MTATLESIDRDAAGAGDLITPADRAEYRERGYWISPKLFDDDTIAELRREVVRTIRNERDYANFTWHGPRENDPDGTAVCQFTNAWWVNRAVRRAVMSPVIGRIGALLMDTPEVRLWHDQVVLKPGVGPDGAAINDGNIGWHQDYAHWQISSTTNMCTAWVALQDTDLTNGGMRTIVGSHKWGLTDNAYTFGEKDLAALERKYQREGLDWIDEPCIMKAGQASFHHALTFHGSGPNLTHEPRMCLIVHMMPDDCALRSDAPRWHLCAALLGPYAEKNQRFTGPFFPRLWPPAEPWQFG